MDGGRRARRLAAAGGEGERGAAILEFIAVFLVLVVPLVYAIVVFADVQRALLASSSAAREAGRLYATAPDRQTGSARALTAYRDLLANYRLPAERAGIRLRSSCPAGAPAPCRGGFGPGAEITVVVTYRVPVTRIPFIGPVAGPSLRVGATHRTRADRYRAFG